MPLSTVHALRCTGLLVVVLCVCLRGGGVCVRVRACSNLLTPPYITITYTSLATPTAVPNPQ